MVAMDRCNTSFKRRLHRLLGTRIELVWARDSTLDPVIGEFEWVEQVLLDMSIRARTVLPYGGRVTIESANVDFDEFAAEGEGLTAGRYVMVEMTCQRMAPAVIGMDEMFPSYFEVQTDLWLESMLPHSKQVLQSLGGNICEYNEPGHALTMRAYFPSAATVVYCDEEDFVLSTTDPNTILLVEDEPYVRDVACEILEVAGYNVVAVGTGPEAIAFVEKQGPVKLLVTDVVMPGMNGRDLSKRLTEIQPGLKTIYMSGYTDNPVVRHDLQAPGLVYIQKPFTLESLTKTVQEVLAV